MTTMPKVLTQKELNAIDEVKKTCGEIAAVSLEDVLLKGKHAKRFHAVDDGTLKAICQIADRHGATLHTRTNRA